MTDHVTYPPSVLLTLAEVHSVTRLSPAFVRIELASAAFVDLGEDGFDTRFKVVLPGPTGELPPIPEVPEDYYALWVDAPDDRRSPMRTYTVRDVVRDRDDVRLVVDFVVHDDDGHGVGPACRWALAARPGDVVQVIAPHLLTEYGGTEFDPAGHRHLLLVGDETAVPAIARILADLGPGHHGEVFLEVPTARTSSTSPRATASRSGGCRATHAAYGRRVVQEVRRHLGLPPSTEFEALPELPSDPESDLDIDVWETPRYSSSGEDVEAQLRTRSLGHDLDDTYAWIAGESWMVKVLRRSLVSELGVERAPGRLHGLLARGRLDEGLTVRPVSQVENPNCLFTQVAPRVKRQLDLLTWETVPGSADRRDRQDRRVRRGVVDRDPGQRAGELGQGRGQVGRVEGLDGDPQPVTLLDRGAGREDLDVDGLHGAGASGFSAALVNGWKAWISFPSR